MNKFWIKNINQRMHDLKLDRITFASRLGVTVGAVGHYLTGRREPTLEQLEKMAKILGITLMDLLTKNTLTEQSAKTDFEIPIIQWNQVPMWNTEMHANLLEQAKEFIPNFATRYSHCYALRIEGDAMTSPQGYIKSFHEGDTIIIDPKRKPTHKSFVIALQQATQTPTFKQYITDGGLYYLKPLNPQYPTLEITDDIYICGVVIANLTLLD